MQASFAALLLTLVLAGTSAHAQTSAERLARSSSAFRATGTVLDGPPPLSLERKAGQVAAGALAGAGASLVGGLIGAALSSCGDGDFLCGLEGAALGILLGEVIGSTVGVHLVGRTEETTGSFGFTLLGSTIGLGAGTLLAAAINTDYLSVPLFLLSAPVGAVFANNLTRRYRNPSQQSGLLNLDRSGFYISAPAVSVTRLADPHRTVARSVRLLTASW